MSTRRLAIRAWLLLLVCAPLAASDQLQPLRPSNVELLCQLGNCLQPAPGTQPAPPLPPRITGVNGLITPKGDVRVVGSGFGGTPGALYLATPGGLHTLTVNPGEWADTLIFGTIPELSGVPDMPGSSIYLIKAGGQEDSNLWPVNFTATREILPLPGDVVRVVSCSAADERNSCNSPPLKGYAVSGYHTGWILGSYGSDAYSISLRNGWTLHQSIRSYGSMPVSCFPMLGSGEVSMNDRGFAAGAGSATLVVDWSYGFCTSMSYHYLISIIGFKGVPYQ